MITAGSSGGCGDIIYAIPVMRRLKVELIYVKESWYRPPFHSLYSVTKDLLKMNGFDSLPTDGAYHAMQYEPGIRIDYDMDRFRLMPGRGRHHIMVNMMLHFKVMTSSWRKPWLTITGKPPTDLPNNYKLIHLTERWRWNSQVDWKKIFSSIRGNVFFIGFKEEHENFCSRYGKLDYLPTNNLLEMAQIIRDCNCLYCNQSVALTLAQGLGKNYFLERNPGKSNTLLGTPNEHILK